MSPAASPSPPKKPSRPKILGHPGLGPLLLALALGAAGGAVFHLLRMPLAWMMGAAVFGTVAAMAGVRVGMDMRLRSGMLVVLGVLLGSGFTPDLVQRIGQWGVSIAIMTAATAASVWVGYTFLRRVGGYDRGTAYFSAMPGGLNEMIAMGSVYGGDERTISLIHALRILTVVMTIPIWFRLVDGAQISVLDPIGPRTGNTWDDYAILAACGVVGAWLAKLVRLPAAFMFGPMLASGAVHLAGWSDSRPPGELVALAQVAIGAAIGCRFVGAVLREVARDMAVAVASAVLLIAVAVGFAWLGHWATGLRPESLVLSYAPGGFAEMSLVGLALGVESAMVATHHLSRIFLIVFLGPPSFRWIAGGKRADDG